MLEDSRIAELLVAHQQAYDLMKWLAEAVCWKPTLLRPEDAALMAKPECARQWIEKLRADIPAHLLPERLNEDFLQLFSSFFATSFRVGHFEFEGQLIESHVRPGLKGAKTSSVSSAHCAYLALKHLCNAENLYVTDEETKLMARRKSLKEALLVWTYLWELDRRARGKGKGTVAHEIWRSIPRATRSALNPEMVFRCKDQILTAVRAYIAEQHQDSEPEISR